MNSNRQFDDHIKEQFNNYAPNVPPHIWENIIAQKDKKRPAGFWISLFSNRNKLLLLGLIIALSSGGAWIYFNDSFQKNNTNTATENKNLHPENNNKSSLSETKSSPEQESNIIGSGTEKITTTNDSGINSNSTLLTDARIKARISPGSVQPGNNKDESNTITEAGNTTMSGENNTNKVKQNKKYVPGLAEDNSNTTHETDNTTIPGNNKITKIKGNKKHYTGLGNILVTTTAPDISEDEFEGQGTLLGRITYNGEKYITKRSNGNPEKLSLNPVSFLPGCPSFEKDAAGNKKYFEFYAGPDYAIRSLHDTGNSAYLQKRKESTKFKSAFSAGIRYTKVFNNSMSVRAGVNFSQINEKFTFNQGNLVQVTYIINNNGDTIGSYTTTGTRYKTTINRYRSIDIPLLVGYEVGNGKLHANINAGPVINIYSWQNGDVLDMAGNPVSITTGKGSSPYQFKTNAGIGFIGAVSIYYKLNNRLHLMAEPYFRYNFSQMNKERITLKQKYQTAGLRLGIRIDLK